MKPTLLAALFLANSAQAATLTVDDSVGAPMGTYPNLSDAVIASAAGDTIEIASLTAPSVTQINLGKNLTIVGLGLASDIHIPRLNLLGTISTFRLERVSLSCDADMVNAAVQAGSMDLTLSNIRASCPDALPRRFFESGGSTALTIVNSSFVGQGVHVSNTWANLTTIEGSTFDGGAVGNNRAIEIVGNRIFGVPSDLVLLNTSIEGYGDGSEGGPAIYIDLGNLSLTGGAIERNYGLGTGAIQVVDGDIDITDTLFRSNVGNHGGAIHLTNGAFSAVDAVFKWNEANGDGGRGGAIYAVSANTDAFDVQDSQFEANIAAGDGGSIYVGTNQAIATIQGSFFCGDDALNTGASIATVGTAVTLDGTVLALPQGAAAPLSMAVIDNDLLIRNVTVVGTAGHGIEATGDGYTLTVDDSIFHDIGGVGISTLLDGGSAPIGGGVRNNWFAMAGANASGVLTDVNFATDQTTDDPLFERYVDRTSSTCANANLWLDIASPLRDLGVRTDPDGSASDIGGFGGPEANLIDGDQDGWFEDLDCDDGNDEVFPGAVEIWYDGQDRNCDGANDFDQDGDGWSSLAEGAGADCDDFDDTVYVGATEVWYDGVDQDCDGANDFDQDGDGTDSDLWGGDDCDDLDATIFVGATEVWYDGLDQDCDGANDYDQDADGYDSSDYTGDDCDDLDDAINPGATDTPDDSIDQDCDGADATGTGTGGTGTGTGTTGSTGTGGTSATGGGGTKEGSGCSALSARPSGAWTLLMGGLLMLRRRR